MTDKKSFAVMNRKALNCSMECLHQDSMSHFKNPLVRVRSCAAGLNSFSSHPIKTLVKDGSTGSLLSIYDDQFSASLDELTDIESMELGRVRREVDDDYLSCYQWYVGKLNRLEAEHCLEGLRDGTYLVRKCEGRSKYTHAIAVRWQRQTFHIRLYKKERMYSVANSRSAKYSSVEELITQFQEHSLAAYFPTINTKLVYPYREEIARLDAELAGCEDYTDELPVELSNGDNDSGLPFSDVEIVDPTAPLIEQEWYHGKLSRSDAETILSHHPDFSFLLRDSESVPGGYSLSIHDVTCNGYIHLRITHQKNGYVLGQYSEAFKTIPEIVAHYCQQQLNIKGITHRSLQYPIPR